MQPIIAYLLKMGLCSGVLLGYYWVALRNERFHQWNRFYLLSALALSVLVPFLNIPFVVAEEPAVVITMVSNLPWNRVVVSPAITWSLENTVVMVAALVSTAMLLRLVLSVIKVVRLYRRHPFTNFENVNLVVTTEQSAPFSFFKWLFWRQDIDPDTENGQRMLQHELTHIGEKHSADKLFTELLLIAFWMNPFFWIMRRELFAIHEFLADQKAIASNDGAAFAAMILQASHASFAPSLSNPFFTSQLKRRLIMITTSHAPKYSYLRRLSGLVLMLATTGVMVLSIERAQGQTAPPPPPPPVPQTENVENLPDSIKSVAVIEKNGVTYIKYLMKDGRKLVYSLDQVKEKQLYLPPPPPPVSAPPPPPPAKIIAPAPVKTIETVPPAKIIGPAPVKTIETVPPAAPSSADNLIEQLQLESGLGNHKPIYIYAGLKITEAQMKEINPNNLDRVDVLKGEEAIKAYGEMAKNGVVSITPKNKGLTPQTGAPQQDATFTIRLTTQEDTQANPNNLVKFYGVNSGDAPSPMYMINAKKASPEQLNALKADLISGINVLKGEDALKKYGNEGKNGVIEITTKDKATNQPVEK